jgi:hypothetical protein
MRLLLRCALFSVIFTVLVAGLLLSTGWAGAFALMYPALRLTDEFLGRSIATSDSGVNNLIALVLVGSVLNFALYTVLFFLLFRAAGMAQRMKARRQSRKGISAPIEFPAAVGPPESD